MAASGCGGVLGRCGAWQLSVGAIRRGNVYRARLGELGMRPVLVVSWDTVNNVLRKPVVCHVTSRQRERALPTAVAISAGEAELQHDSYVLCHELHTLDAEDIREELGELSDWRMHEVDRALAAALDLDLG